LENNFSNIPAELRELERWVLWNKDKHPLQPSGKPASVSDPSTWSSFGEVMSAYRNRSITGKPFLGVGFVFTENDPYCGIDLDGVMDENGVIKPEAQTIIDKMDSYTEVSQSGHGIHIIVKGKKPSNWCRRENVEIYDKGRYFALTGNLWQKRSVA
jgi:putative DNA primase/helicase